MAAPDAVAPVQAEPASTNDVVEQSNSQRPSRTIRTPAKYTDTPVESSQTSRKRARNASGSATVPASLGENSDSLLVEMLTTLHDDVRQIRSMVAAKDDEIKLLKDMIDQLRAEVSRLSPAPTYSSVVTHSGPASSPPTSARTLNTVRTETPSADASLPVSAPSSKPSTKAQFDPSVIINLTDAVESGLKSTSFADKKVKTTQALATKNIHMRGLIGLANPHKMRILLHSEADARILRTETDWISSYFKGAKLDNPPDHLVRLDRVPKAAVVQEGDGHARITAEMCTALGEQNPREDKAIIIRKAVWLSSPNAGKKYGSVALHLENKSDAEWLIEHGIFEINGETTFVKPFETRPALTRCYRCQRFDGHLATQCNHTVRCSRCAAEGHSSQECMAETLKCSLCDQEGHSVAYKACPAYKAKLNALLHA